MKSNLLTDETIEALKKLNGVSMWHVGSFIQHEDDVYQRAIINSGCDFDRREMLKREFNQHVIEYADFVVAKNYSNEAFKCLSL